MSNFVKNLLNLCLVPFHDESLFIVVAGLLLVCGMFTYVWRMIRGKYYG